MDIQRLTQTASAIWRVEPHGRMTVPVIFYADAMLLAGMDDKVLEQAVNVAGLPGMIEAVYVMPDGHWGYGFPIGGVAAFDAQRGGVVSAGGVGFDISCGVRCHTTGVSAEEVESLRTALADALFERIPAGVGSSGSLSLSNGQMDQMLAGGARWAVDQGYGHAAELERCEERGCMAGADPQRVSTRARSRQRREMGTLGSGNHYLELQRIDELFDEDAAAQLGLAIDEVVVTIHCGSRGLGHQIGTEFLRAMVEQAQAHGLELPDRELACAPIESELGSAYLGAMRAAINCAFANRQILTHLTRELLLEYLPSARVELLYDVSHNTCKQERHLVDGVETELFVHRKGATRSWGPGHPGLPADLRELGQPVFIGGSMGTESWILLGTGSSEALSWSSTCHGAGRSMSRHAATKRWRGRAVVDELAARGITVRSVSSRGVAEEAPGAYKDVRAVVDVAHEVGLARKLARLVPLICIKG